MAHPGARLGRVLGWAPLRWLGERSYGLYLWHYPVIVLATPLWSQWAGWERDGMEVGLSLLLAALSWRWVEQPLRRWDWAAQGWRLPRFRRPWRLALVATGLLAGGTVDAAGLLGLSPVPVLPAPHRLAVESLHPASRPRDRARGGTPPPFPPSELGAHVTAIGDSVMVDAAPFLEQALPGITVSAQVGRQLIAAPPVIRQLQAAGALHRFVIVELGTNGPFTAAQLRALLHAMGPHHWFVLVNTREPRPWETAVNTVIDRVAATYPHTLLVNWYQESAAVSQDFYPDEVHLNPQGARFYAGLLAQAVRTLYARWIRTNPPPSRQPAQQTPPGRVPPGISPAPGAGTAPAPLPPPGQGQISGTSVTTISSVYGSGARP
ncbi:MAG: hypothetical protein OWV35_05180 [Firmicutes bacterium]|nr:hypothetical protein [Bacillota bacterium]